VSNIRKRSNLQITIAEESKLAGQHS